VRPGPAGRVRPGPAGRVRPGPAGRVRPGPSGPGAAGAQRGRAQPAQKGRRSRGRAGTRRGPAARNPACLDVDGLRFLRLTCPITLDTERYLADDTKGRRSCGVLNARMVERSGSAERHEGRQSGHGY